MFLTGKQYLFLVSLLICVIANGIYAQIEFEDHPIDVLDHPTSVFAIDLDSDGDTDVLSAGMHSNAIVWWDCDEDLDFDIHFIDDMFQGAVSVYAVDIDGDDDIDVLGAGYGASEIAWYENDGNQDFEKHIIAEGYLSAEFVTAIDLDLDGDMDVLGVSVGNRCITWWENDGDQQFDEHLIGNNFERPVNIFAIDLDRDEDIDVLSADFIGDKVSWWENDGDQNFEEHLIQNNFDAARWVHAADMDNDGDIDVVGTARDGDMVALWENNGEQEFEEHIIEDNYEDPYGIYTIDLDSDGDVDILAAAASEDNISWWENEGDLSFRMHSISGDFDRAFCVYAEDVDSDGDIDVLGGAVGEDAIYWWENLSPNFDLIVEPEALNFGPVEIDTDRMMNLRLTHLSENENVENISVALRVTQGRDWLHVEPQEALIARNDDLNAEVSVFIQEGEEPGPYQGLISIIPNGLEDRVVNVLVSLFAVEGFGSLRGDVTDAATGQVIPGATVELEGIPLQEMTDEDGSYLFDHLPSWTYNAIVNVDNYLPYLSDEFYIEPNHDVELDIGLLHAVCLVDMDSICVDMLPDSTIEADITITNSGNGPLRYSVESRFPAIGDAEAWDHRTSVDAAEQCGDDRLQGVEFAEGSFYVTGGNNGDGRGFVHVFSREGEHTRSFDQFRDSQWGMRDLAWDGELLWGSDDETIYGFTTDGDLREQFDGPLDINRAITWDEEHGRLWVCDIGSDLFGMDRSGNLLDMVDISPELHIYGLGTYPEDTLGCTIYTFNKDGQFDSQVNRLSTETGEMEFVTDFETVDELKAGGACITGNYDPMSWVYIGILQGRQNVQDEIAVWHISTRSVWLHSEPDSGTVDPDGSEVIDVTINSDGYPYGVELSGELVITHNGRGDRVIVPVILRVVREGGIDPKTQDTEIPTGCLLAEPYPNPFNSSTTIGYRLPERSEVLLQVFDLNGRVIETIVAEKQNPGSYSVNWNAGSVPAGLYFCRIEAGSFSQTGKLVLVK